MKNVSRDTIKKIRVDKIYPNPAQARIDFDKGGLVELAQPIKATGLLQPIIVRPVGNRFQIIVGERRWRAHKLAGLSEIDAIIRDSDNSKAGSLIENVQREDLSVGKKAAALDMAHIVSQVENDSSSLVSVALQSGSYPSVFEENAEDFVFLTFRDDI